MATRCYGCMKEKNQHPVCEHCGWDGRKQNDSHQLCVGTLLEDRYLIGRVLGQGGFGITYMGWDTALDMRVAIKEFFPSGQVMRESATSTEVTVYTDAVDEHFRENRNRFLREAKALAKFINIPQIVHIHNFFQANNTAYIVMEYVDGMTLRNYVRSRGKLSQEETMSLLGPVLIGLEQVHRGGIVHRDISPDNIMLLPGGAKLLDFGAVRDVTGATPGSDATKSTAAILKQGYAPIEQYRGKGDLGPWTDVYALCATICFCLTGETPPDAPERVMANMTGEDDGLHFDEIAPGNPALQKALEHGMAHVSVNRTRSVAQLVEEMTPEEVRREQAEKERRERQAKEKAERERLAQEARIRAEQERKEREARERAERQRREQEARERAEQERLAREAREKAERERKEQEAREKAERERLAREAKIKAEQERKEREAAERAERQRKKQEAKEKAEQERREREAKRKEAAVRTAVKEEPEQKTGSHKKPIAVIALVCVLLIGAAAFLLTGDPQSRDYKNAVSLMESGNYAEAMEILVSLGEYEDSAAQLERCRELLQEEQYRSALALFESGDYAGAADAFAALGDYRDSASQAQTALNEKGYAEAETLADAGEYAKAGIAFAKLGDYRDAREKSFEAWHKTYRRTTFVSDYNMIDHQDYAVAIKNDGTVHFTGSNPSPRMKYDVPNWTDMVELAGRPNAVFGLREDGTVAIAGETGRYPNVSSWTDIVRLTEYYGIRSDGTLAYTGETYALTAMTYYEPPAGVFEWMDIVDLDTCRINTYNVAVGLKTDGTVVVAGDKTEELVDATQWEDIVSVHLEYCSRPHQCIVVGITADGAVLTTGNLYQAGIGKDLRGAVWMEGNYVLFEDGTVRVYDPNYGAYNYDIAEAERKIQGWDNIERIYGPIGLRKDGTVVVTEGNYYSANEKIAQWTDIVEIYYAPYDTFTVALRKDGKLFVADAKTTKVSNWEDVRLP